MLAPILSMGQVNTFYGRAHILRDLDIVVHRGAVTAILGRNGAGKSTTLKSIIGLVAVASGAVLLDGTPITNQPPYRIARAGVGYVPEERRIFTDLTVTENLLVGRQPQRDGVPRWTPESLFEIFPNLGSMKTRLGGRMSGGEQQMLAIARTLMGNPRLLLLDEPSEGLAPKIVDQMATAIQRIAGEGVTVVLSEQNLRFAECIASTVAIIEKGSIRFSGTASELRQNPELQREYLSV